MVEEGKAKSVILIWMGGGPSHLDLWDLKPDAPQEVRGFLNPIGTNVPGIEICEHLPRIAKQMDKMCVIRSMTSMEADHGRGTHYLMTGFQPLPGFAVPSYGSVGRKVEGTTFRAAAVYCDSDSVRVFRRRISRRGFGSVLGRRRSVKGWIFKCMTSIRPRALRWSVLIDADHCAKQWTPRSRSTKAAASACAVSDEFYDAAYNLISSSEAREAFDLKREPDNLRDAYRRDDFGQSCLLARRLVEAGVGFVTVSNGGWDMHSNIYPALAGKLGGFDQTVGDAHRRPFGARLVG